MIRRAITTAKQWAAGMTLAVCAIVALTPGTAKAQGRLLTVSQATNCDVENCGMFTKLQPAIDAAERGDIITILDNAVYKEHITIQGPSKAGITIRSLNPTGPNSAKPVIQWQDVTSRAPRNEDQAKNPDSSGKFSESGALRVIATQGVILDGIIIDGGGAAPFSYGGFWGGEHFHANGAVALVQAGGVVIRNCVLRNAYFGVSIKDRNVGGVFGSPNPHDNDTKDIIPISAFGDVGYHLIEYNRIHDNSVGIYAESAWDLGSTVRHNLIYNNYHKTTTVNYTDPPGTAPPGQPNNAITAALVRRQAQGGFLFRDVIFTPFAIYNNTFYGNGGNFRYVWKAGATHLLFNNIHSRLGSEAVTPNLNDHPLEDKFPFRMNNSVFAAMARVQIENPHVSDCRDESQGIWGQSIPGVVTTVGVMDIFNSVSGVPSPIQCLPPIQHLTGTTNIARPGTFLTGAGGITVDAKLSWLETAGSTSWGTTFPSLFASEDPDASNFLQPLWNNDIVMDVLRNKGWEAAGMRNNNGDMADIGAIPSSGRQQTVVRIKPSSVVMVNQANVASARFFIQVEDGRKFDNPRVKLLRWVAPLQGTEGEPPIIPFENINTVTPTTMSLSIGGSSMTFPATNLASSDSTGFIEVIVEGDGANGIVTSDVGFLPYRKSDNELRAEVFSGTTRVDTVRAGETYRLEITAYEKGVVSTKSSLNFMSFKLDSDPSAKLVCVDNAGGCAQAGGAGVDLAALLNVPNVPLTGGKVSFNVYFTNATYPSAESISLSGLWSQSQSGGGDVYPGSHFIVVRPGLAHDVRFIDPMSKATVRELGGLPGTIPRGMEQEVQVGIYDRFGNLTDDRKSVSIEVVGSFMADWTTPAPVTVGTVSPASVMSGEDGIARFTARVADGAATNQIFDMRVTASVPGVGEDVGSLRVGRILDALRVFYGDVSFSPPGVVDDWTVYYNPDSIIDGVAGEWYQITVKAVVGDTVTTGRPLQYIYVEPSVPGLVFAPTVGGARDSVFTLSNGVATFFVTSAEGMSGDIIDAAVYVTALRTRDINDVDMSIAAASRGDINFRAPSTDIHYAMVYGDGHGRPDSVSVHYLENMGFTTNPASVPSGVSLRWPFVGSDAVPATSVRVVNDTMIVAVFTGAAKAGFSTGYTGIGGDGMGLVTVTGGIGGANAEAYLFPVLDAIGPIISRTPDGIAGKRSPAIFENLTGVADTLIVWISELVDDQLLVGSSSVYYTTAANPPNEPASGTGDGSLVVTDVMYDAISLGSKLVLAASSYVPKPGDWIRLNPASGITDVVARSNYGTSNNPVRADNRWVQVTLRTSPPDIARAYYTSSSMTGMLDSAVITFNKAIDDFDYWFAGSRFLIGNDDVPIGSLPSTFVRPLPGRDSSIYVDLSVACPSVTGIKTGGTMTVSIIFDPANDWPDPATGILLDKAKPVLARDVTIKQGAMRDTVMDTFVVWYSETVVTGVAQPLSIIPQIGGDTKEPTLTFYSGREEDGFYEVKYVIRSTDVPYDIIMTGDSVRINSFAGLADMVMGDPNEQDDLNNRQVRLVIDRGTINWDVKIANNPFRGGSTSTVTFDPQIRGASVKITTTIRLYDNVGRLVRDEKVTNDVSADMNLLKWVWDGTNTNGRMVGTGTYLLKAVCQAEVMREGVAVEKLPRYSTTRLIGFVR